MRQAGNIRGFTLIEIVLVITIAGILVAVAIRTAKHVADTVRMEETKQELDALARAVIGNPELHNNGVRSDFGYVGDVGAMPPNLDALASNPGGYSTWNGPYIGNRFAQIADDYKTDAWGVSYSYGGGVTVTSTGSGSNVVRRLAASEDHLLRNSAGGVVLDLDGTPPGNNCKDSVSAQLTTPDGAGSLVTKITGVDAGGYFVFDSIPVGNHDIDIIYLPDSDTLKRFVSVLPNSSLYSEYRLATDVWSAAGSGPGGISLVADSDTLWTGNCSRLKFWIVNNSGAAITASTITLTWSSPVAYYRTVTWDGTTVRDSAPYAGSGEASSFLSGQTINDGEQLRITVEEFKANPDGGGAPVNMTGTQFTVEFSDGSTFGFTANLCN